MNIGLISAKSGQVVLFKKGLNTQMAQLFAEQSITGIFML